MTKLNSPLQEPLHVGTINGESVLFFTHPGDGPNFPCHVVDDLFRACRLSEEQRRIMFRIASQDPQLPTRKPIATSSGPVVLASHAAAQGLVAASIEMGFAPEGTDADYTLAAFKAVEAQLGNPSTGEMMRFVFTAMDNGDLESPL